jgi:hypothetical protein
VIETRHRRCEITGNQCGTDTWMKGSPCHCPQCAAWLDEMLAETALRLAAVEGHRAARDLQVETATRAQLIVEAEQWVQETYGWAAARPKEDLRKRLKALKIKLPDTMIVAKRDVDERWELEPTRRFCEACLEYNRSEGCAPTCRARPTKCLFESLRERLGLPLPADGKPAWPPVDGGEWVDPLDTTKGKK